MTTIADGLKDVFLAGVGAMALGAEKTQELVEQLIAKGEITVEQGKEINSEVLRHTEANGQAGGSTGANCGRRGISSGENCGQPSERPGQDGRRACSRADRSRCVHGVLPGRDGCRCGHEGDRKRQAYTAHFATALKHDVLEAQMAMMTPEQRAEFAKKLLKLPPAMRKRNSWQEILPRSSSFRNRKRNPHVAGSFHREGCRAPSTRCRCAGSCRAGSRRWCRPRPG